jgi:predicted DNA-binding protein (UPF0251 family)
MARIPSDPPDDELTPRQLHDRVDAVVNLTADELEAFRASEYNQDYLEANSDRAQEGNEPLDDVITSGGMLKMASTKSPKRASSSTFSVGPKPKSRAKGSARILSPNMTI